MAFHPSPSLRAKAINSPISVFETSKWLMLLIGLLLGASTENFRRLSPLWNVMNDASAVITKLFDPDAYGSGMPIQPLFSGFVLVLVLSVGFVSIVRVGARTGLVIAAAPGESRHALQEVLTCLVVFVVGYCVAGPLLVNIGTWMNRGFPSEVGDYVPNDILYVTLLIAAGMLGSTLPGFAAGRYFGGSYRPRFTLVYCYWCGWALLNCAGVFADSRISPPSGFSKFTAVTVMIVCYVVLPGIVAFSLDKVLQRRATRSEAQPIKGGENPPSRWYLRGSTYLPHRRDGHRGAASDVSR
jgi:hypothetical protein